MPEDKAKAIREAIQEFYEKTGIRITELRVEWAIGDVVQVRFDGKQP